MIVCCPACRTRYRYQEPVPDIGGRAICSECEGVVPLVEARRAYVLRAQVAAVPAGVPVGVVGTSGMNHPARASNLEHTALDDGSGHGAPDAAYRVMPPQPASDPIGSPFGAPVDLPGEPISAAEKAVPPVAAVDSLSLNHGGSTPRPRSEDPGDAFRDEVQVAPSRARRVARRIMEMLVLVVLAAAGAAAGEYATMEGWLGPVEVHSAVAPVRLGIIGGLLGVLIAWAAIRWKNRKS